MRIIMRKLGLVVALAGTIAAGLALSGGAQAAPVSSAAIGDAAAAFNVVDKTQYIYGGRSHCWYNSGWKGPGWYWCGYRWRRGYGWGGPRGWNNWTYSGWGPAVVVAPGAVVVRPGRYYWGGRYYAHRRWHGGRWVYY
jgi:hypothetical protein